MSLDDVVRRELLNGAQPTATPPPQNIVTLPGLGTFLDHTLWNGVPVTLSTLVEDGTVIMLGRRQIIIGSRPRTPIELDRYRARWIVQTGLRDVVEWLGERVIPERPVTGQEILDGIRRGIV